MVILIIYKYIETRTYDVSYVESDINGKSYLVRNLPDKQEAANLMANMTLKLEKLIAIITAYSPADLYSKYIADDSDLIAELHQYTSEPNVLVAKDIKRLLANFNPDNFSENTPDSKYTSYSVNKGEKIIFCIRDKNEHETLVNDNIMMFVSIHELSHLMTKSIGHEPDFWTNFKILLKIAMMNGIYTYIDFNSKPKQYCGTTITDSPLKI
jgi:hypothetical protein